MGALRADSLNRPLEGERLLLAAARRGGEGARHTRGGESLAVLGGAGAVLGVLAARAAVLGARRAVAGELVRHGVDGAGGALEARGLRGERRLPAVLRGRLLDLGCREVDGARGVVCLVGHGVLLGTGRGDAGYPGLGESGDRDQGYCLQNRVCDGMAVGLAVGELDRERVAYAVLDAVEGLVSVGPVADIETHDQALTRVVGLDGVAHGHETTRVVCVVHE